MMIVTKRIIYVSAVIWFFILLFFLFPLKKEKLFDSPYSTLLLANDGTLLHSEIASDYQWRFPVGPVPEKFKISIIEFEDRKFQRHNGVRISSILRAAYQNIKAGEIVSGGSTITMQIVRLSRQKNRNYLQKFAEALISLRWEIHLTKEEILELYASHAPFGGNIVGIEAASYRYFGRSPDFLSWSESALLAVLPNAPSLLYPGKNSQLLKEKRDRLLYRLFEQGYFDQTTLEISLEESIPFRLYHFPSELPHLLLRARAEGYIGKRVYTTIDKNLQSEVEYIIEKHYRRLTNNKIENSAALILDTVSGNVLAYVGNTYGSGDVDSNQVDNISAQRSTGSILKPFLFASMVGEGELLPNQLISDYPFSYGGFKPENYHSLYEGAVPASQALINSLNVPFVYLLNEYGLDKFYNKLEDVGIPLTNPPSYYGLSLIVGGSESTLWDISSAYAGMARSLIKFNETGEYFQDNYRENIWVLEDRDSSQTIESFPPLRASSIYLTFDSMKELVRPNEDAGWVNFDSSYPIAWKTGTSWGFRDSWSVGVTPGFVIAVWVGNSSGEGRPGNRGSTAAAPILFDLADLMESGSWFEQPNLDIQQVKFCSKSGMLYGKDCEDFYYGFLPDISINVGSCIYHKTIHLDQSETYRVDSSCYPVDLMVHKKWFVLPPIEQWYYRYRHGDYRLLPEWLPGSEQSQSIKMLDIIYPTQNSRVIIPIEVDGSQGKVIFQAAHANSNTLLYWYLDENFVGTTDKFHQMEFSPGSGSHQLSIYDEAGEFLQRDFFVEKNDN